MGVIGLAPAQHAGGHLVGQARDLAETLAFELLCQSAVGLTRALPSIAFSLAALTTSALGASSWRRRKAAEVGAIEGCAWSSAARSCSAAPTSPSSRSPRSSGARPAATRS